MKIFAKVDRILNNENRFLESQSSPVEATKELTVGQSRFANRRACGYHSSSASDYAGKNLEAHSDTIF